MNGPLSSVYFSFPAHRCTTALWKVRNSALPPTNRKTSRNENTVISLVERSAYSRVPNKRTGLLLENEKKSTYTHLLGTMYTFINFQQKGPPIFVLSHAIV